MIPKQKAQELVSKMEKDFQYFASREVAIKHALICVDEIIEILWHTCKNENEYRYWQQVKEEIQKL